jgi:hypothetical protein
VANIENRSRTRFDSKIISVLLIFLTSRLGPAQPSAHYCLDISIETRDRAKIQIDVGEPFYRYRKQAWYSLLKQPRITTRDSGHGQQRKGIGLYPIGRNSC